MEVNDFINPEKVEGFTGTMLGFNRVLAGSIYYPDMSKVPSFDVKNWDPVFTPEVIRKFSISIGYKCYVTPDVENVVGIGNQCNPTGDNSIHLGWASHNVTTLRGFYRRADARDMEDIEALQFQGLPFVLRLRPVKARPIFRERHLDETHPFPFPVVEPSPPKHSDYEFTDDAGVTTFDQSGWDKAMLEYNTKKAAYDLYVTEVLAVRQARKTAYPTLDKVGTKESDYRYGFIAKEVKTAADDTFGDFKPHLFHKDANGYDTDYLDYEQLIPPMVLALQQEYAHITLHRGTINSVMTKQNDIIAALDAMKTMMETDLGLDVSTITIPDVWTDNDKLPG